MKDPTLERLMRTETSLGELLRNYEQDNEWDDGLEDNLFEMMDDWEELQDVSLEEE